MSPAELVITAGAVVVALTTISGALLWLIKPRVVEFIRKINETHKQVTVNGGRTNPPTMLDLIGSIDKRLDDHLAVAERDSADLARVMRHVGLIR